MRCSVLYIDNVKKIICPFAILLGLCACASDNPRPATDTSSEPATATAQPLPQSVPSTLFEVKTSGADKQVRVVAKPTLAALDYAAYSANPIRLAGKDEKPENYAGKMASAKIGDYPFPMLESLSESAPAAVAGSRLRGNRFRRFFTRRRVTTLLESCSTLSRR